MEHYTADPQKIIAIREAMQAGDYEPLYDFMMSNGPYGLIACLSDPALYAIFRKDEWPRERSERFNDTHREMLLRHPREAAIRRRKKVKPECQARLTEDNEGQWSRRTRHNIFSPRF